MAGTISEHIENLNLEESDDDTGRTENPVPGDDQGTDPGDTKGADANGGAKNKDTERPADDGTGAGKDEGSGESDDDNGYLADELEEEPEPEEQQEVPSSVSPELKYVVDNLPEIAVRGRTSPNGPLRTYNVKAAQQLPDEFEFASSKEQANFFQAVAAQEYRARELMAQFQQQQQQQQTKRFSDQENSEIRSDIADLQREGLLPKYKYAPNDRRFESDPGVKASQEVLDFMNEVNNEYARAGKLYHINYRTAFELISKQKAEESGRSKQNAEDRARKEVTRQLAGAQGAPSTGLSRPRVARNMEDLKSRIDMLDF